MAEKTLEWVTLCPAADIPDGAREVFDVNGKWIAVFNVGDRYYAIEDLCPHDEGTLTEDERGNPMPLDGYEIACSRHGSRFDIRTGKVQNPPAMVDVPWYETRIHNGDIQIAWKA